MYDPTRSQRTAAAVAAYVADGTPHSWEAVVRVLADDVAWLPSPAVVARLVQAQVRLARAQQVRDDEALDVAIELASTDPPPGPDGRAFLVVELTARGERARQRAGTADLERLVAALPQALASADSYTADLVSICLSGHVSLYQQTRDRAYLDQAEALVGRSMPPGVHPLTAAALTNNEANLRFEQALLSGEPADFDRTVAVIQEAFRRLPARMPDDLEAAWEGALAALTLTLVQAVGERWRVLSDPSGRAEARALVEERLARMSEQHPMWPHLVAARASAALDDAALKGDAHAGDQAVTHFRTAVATTTPGTTGHLSALSGLVAALEASFAQRGDEAALHEAIQVNAEALDTVAGPPATYFAHSLAVCLRDRFFLDGDLQDLEEALSLHEQVAEVAEPDDANADLRELEHGITAYAAFQESGDSALLERAFDLLLRTAHRGAPTLLRLRALHHVAAIATAESRWTMATDAAQRALSQLEELTLVIRAEEWVDWLRPVQGASVLGATGAARVGNVTAALELLERGAGIEASARLGDRLVTLERARAAGHEDLVERLEERAAVVRRLLQEAGSTQQVLVAGPAAAVASALHAAVSRLAEARAALEAGVGPLQPSASAGQIVEHVQLSGTPLAYLAAGPTTGLRIDVLPGRDAGQAPELGLTWLPLLVEEEVALLGDTLVDWATGAGVAAVAEGPVARGDHPPPPGDVVGGVMADLRAMLGGGVAGASAPPIRLVAAGGLISLPVAAALADVGGHESVSVAVSGRLHLAAAGRFRPDGPPQIVALTNPTPCDHDGTRWPPLPGAEAEGEELSAHHNAIHYTRTGATAGRLAASLVDPDVDIVHVAAHGLVAHDGIQVLMTNGPDGAAEVLSEGQLPTHIDGTFVVLTCCWLGSSSDDLPDEARGFPTWLLRSGAAGVVAPLWPVDDQVVREFTTAFYWHWLVQGQPAARAARLAAIDLRDWADDELRSLAERSALRAAAEAFVFFGG